eukprot:6477965-Prymnesium_polylepis.1
MQRSANKSGVGRQSTAERHGELAPTGCAHLAALSGTRQARGVDRPAAFRKKSSRDSRER